MSTPISSAELQQVKICSSSTEAAKGCWLFFFQLCWVYICFFFFFWGGGGVTTFFYFLVDIIYNYIYVCVCFVTCCVKTMVDGNRNILSYTCVLIWYKVVVSKICWKVHPRNCGRWINFDEYSSECRAFLGLLRGWWQGRELWWQQQQQQQQQHDQQQRQQQQQHYHEKRQQQQPQECPRMDGQGQSKSNGFRKKRGGSKVAMTMPC